MLILVPDELVFSSMEGFDFIGTLHVKIGYTHPSPLCTIF